MNLALFSHTSVELYDTHTGMQNFKTSVHIIIYRHVYIYRYYDTHIYIQYVCVCVSPPFSVIRILERLLLLVLCSNILYRLVTTDNIVHFDFQFQELYLGQKIINRSNKSFTPQFRSTFTLVIFIGNCQISDLIFFRKCLCTCCHFMHCDYVATVLILVMLLNRK